MNPELDLMNPLLSKRDYELLVKYLEFAEDSRLFYTNSEATPGLISTVNSLLNQTKRKASGLRLLKYLLPQCSNELISKNVLNWTGHCLKVISGNASNDLLELSLELLNLLLPLSVEYPEAKRDLSREIAPKLLATLLKDSARENQFPYLKCLEVFLKYYGKSCGGSKEKAENFVLFQIESSKNLVVAAGRCYLNLAAAGSPGTDFEAFKTAWKEQQKFLVGSMHRVLNAMFENVSEIEGTYQKYLPGPDSKKIPDVVDDVPFVRAVRLASQFEGLSQFLSILLLGSFPTKKHIMPELLFSIICRGLSITCPILKSNISIDSLNLITQVPLIQTSCINVLDSMIRSLKTNLLPHGLLICKLLAQTLKWTQTKDWAYGQAKPYRSLRAAAFDCLATWLTVSRVSSNVEKQVDDIIASILSEVHTQKPSVVLNIKTKSLKGKQGRKQRNAMMMSQLEEKLEFAPDVEGNKEVVASALNVIPFLLVASSSTLNPNYHKDLQEKIITELIAVQLKPDGTYPIPYSDVKCRLKLYSALMSLCMSSHPNFPPPLSYAVKLFTAGLHDPSFEVSQYCSLGVNTLEKVLRPSGPTMDLPFELSDQIQRTVELEDVCSPSSPDGNSQCSSPEQILMESHHQVGHPVVENGVSHMIESTDPPSPELVCSTPTPAMEPAMESSQLANPARNSNEPPSKRVRFDDSKDEVKEDKVEEVNSTLNSTAPHEISELETEMLNSFVDLTD